MFSLDTGCPPGLLREKEIYVLPDYHFDNRVDLGLPSP